MALQEDQINHHNKNISKGHFSKTKGDEYGYAWLLLSRATRNVAIVFMTIAAPLYLYILNIPLQIIGVTYVSIMVFGIGISLLIGFFGDRYGYRKLLIFAEIFPVFGALLMSFNSNPEVIITAIIIGGIGGVVGLRGTFTTGLIPLIMSNYDDEKVRVRKLATLSYVGAFTSIIGAGMVAIQPYIANFFGGLDAYRLLYLLAFAMMFVSLISLFGVKERQRPKKTKKVMKKESFNYLIKIIALNLINTSALGLTLPLLSLWLSLVFKINNYEISIILAGTYLFTAIGSYYTSKIHFKDILKIAARMRLSQGILTLIVGLIAFFISLNFMAVQFGIIIFILCYMLMFLIIGIAASPLSVVNIRGIDKEDYGTASSFQEIAIAIGLSASGASALLMTYSLSAPFIIAGILFLIGGILYEVLLREHKSSAEKEILP